MIQSLNFDVREVTLLGYVSSGDILHVSISSVGRKQAITTAWKAADCYCLSSCKSRGYVTDIYSPDF